MAGAIASFPTHTLAFPFPGHGVFPLSPVVCQNLPRRALRITPTLEISCPPDQSTDQSVDTPEGQVL